MKHWIGREVKRFLTEAHLHLPFLLQLAAAPLDLVPDTVQQFTNDDGLEEMQIDKDDAFAPTDAEIESEEKDEPVMMQHAEMWDNFLEWVRAVQAPWEDDSDEYRDRRAVEYFNHSMRCSRDLKKLKPTLQSWVPHISCFVVPRQIRTLGDPASRAADACESYGSMVKKIIKHNTCRRRVNRTGVPAKRGEKKWNQVFTRGYIEQAFRKCCVRESLLHGEANAPFLQRADWKLKQKGVKTEKSEKAREVPPSVRSRMAAEVDAS